MKSDHLQTKMQSKEGLAASQTPAQDKMSVKLSVTTDESSYGMESETKKNNPKCQLFRDSPRNHKTGSNSPMEQLFHLNDSFRSSRYANKLEYTSR